MGRSGETTLMNSCLLKLREKWKITGIVLLITCMSCVLVSKHGIFMYGDRDVYFQRAFEDRPNYNGACVNRHVVMAKLPLPKTVLASFPGSGNTWTRHLIQQLTGLATSSEYCDRRLLKNGFPFECHKEKNKAIVTKTHELNIHNYKKAVVLVRSPYEAIISYFKIEKTGHVGNLPQDILQKTAEEDFNNAVKRYIDFHHAWFVDFKGEIHLLQYSSLKQDMTSELRALASFLDVPVTPFELQCTVRLQEGNHHRNVSMDRIIQMRDTYSIPMRKQLKRVIKRVKGMVKDRCLIDIDLGDDITIALDKS